MGSQPNCSPHIGNITTFATGFALAAALRANLCREVRIKFIYVDSAQAPGQDITINGIRYQRSLKQTGDFWTNQSLFAKVLDQLSNLSKVPYDVETQNFGAQTLRFQPSSGTSCAQHITLGSHVSPETDKLAIRASRPREGCRLADKHGVNNRYHDDSQITFVCPDHGEHHVNPVLPQDLERLGFSTPLRNLIRILICSQDPDKSWIMCTGSDYAGFYQEQLTWRLLERPKNAPIIFYSPLIVDWSGVKLSKSQYVKQAAYKYVMDAGRQYMLDADTFLKTEGGLKALFEEVQDWVEKPYILFRNYSIDYLDVQLMSRGMRLL